MLLDIYLASPNSQQQAEHAADMDVLLSYAVHRTCQWLDKGYWQSFNKVLVDSGAYSAHTTGKPVDVLAFADWSDYWRDQAVAIASLDDISGNWKQGLKNIEVMPDGIGFPTFHETDPYELLDDLIPIARERGGWVGLGMLPETRQRRANEEWVRESCDRIPDDLHVHGWALRAYTHVRRLNSVDSTNWWRDAMKIRTLKDCEHLNYGECLEIVVKRYQRWTRVLREPKAPATTTVNLFGETA